MKPFRPIVSRTPLDGAIVFERYRLAVVSRWPDDDVRQEKIAIIESNLQRLESERADLQHQGARATAMQKSAASYQL